MARVKARKDEIVGQSNRGVTNWLNNAPNVTLIEGHGRFEGPRTVRVNGRLLEAPGDLHQHRRAPDRARRWRASTAFRS